MMQKKIVCVGQEGSKFTIQDKKVNDKDSVTLVLDRNVRRHLADGSLVQYKRPAAVPKAEPKPEETPTETPAEVKEEALVKEEKDTEPKKSRKNKKRKKEVSMESVNIVEEKGSDINEGLTGEI